MKYFRQEILIDFLKEQIIRTQMPYTDKINLNVNAVVLPNIFDVQPELNENVVAQNSFNDGDEFYNRYVKKKNVNKIGDDNYGDVLRLKDNKKETDSIHDLNKKIDDNPLDFGSNNGDKRSDMSLHLENNEKGDKKAPETPGKNEFQVSDHKDNDICNNL